METIAALFAIVLTVTVGFLAGMLVAHVIGCLATLIELMIGE